MRPLAIDVLSDSLTSRRLRDWCDFPSTGGASLVPPCAESTAACAACHLTAEKAVVCATKNCCKTSKTVPSLYEVQCLGIRQCMRLIFDLRYVNSTRRRARVRAAQIAAVACQSTHRLCSPRGFCFLGRRRRLQKLPCMRATICRRRPVFAPLISLAGRLFRA